MGFEEELFHELATNTWDKRSRMQQEMVKGAKGEPFAVQELYRKGPLTPSQLASSMKTTTGRVSTLLSALEKKGQITRESDPDDRRVVHVNLTEAGRERAERQRESMYTISQKYGIRLEKLYKMNHLDPNIPVSVGSR